MVQYFKGCDSKFEVKYSNIFQISSNEAPTVH